MEEESEEIVEEELEGIGVKRTIKLPSEVGELGPVVTKLGPEPVEVESIISPPLEILTISDEVNPDDAPLPSLRNSASTLSLSGGLGYLISPPTFIVSVQSHPNPWPPLSLS